MTGKTRDWASVLPDPPAAELPAAAAPRPPVAPPPPQGPPAWLEGKRPETYLYEQAVRAAFRPQRPEPEPDWAVDFIWGE